MIISFRYRFEAAHRFVKTDSVMCRTPHGHTWYITLSLDSGVATLDENNMVGEFHQLKKQWKKFVQEELDHSYFHHHQDPLLPALKETVPDFRGFATPGEPTTEMLAVLFLRKAQVLFGNKKVLAKEIYLEETPTNSVRISTEDLIFKDIIGKTNKASWFHQEDITSRLLEI